MRINKSDIGKIYHTAKDQGTDVLITPEAAHLLRGLLRLTLQRTANIASVKRNQLDHFEKEGRPLSLRDRRWLQSTFESAGAEFFMGQETLQVRLNGNPVIVFGSKDDSLRDLPFGDNCREERWDRGWSQNDTAKVSGVSRVRISAIENCRRKKFYLADQVALKSAFDAHPV